MDDYYENDDWKLLTNNLVNLTKFTNFDLQVGRFAGPNKDFEPIPADMVSK